MARLQLLLKHSTKLDACCARAVPMLTFHAHVVTMRTYRVHAVAAATAAMFAAVSDAIDDEFDVLDDCVCANYADDGLIAVESASNCHESYNYFAEDPIDSSHAMPLLHDDFVVAGADVAAVDAYLTVYLNGSSWQPWDLHSLDCF